VDSSIKDKIQIAKEDLRKLLTDKQLKDTIILILANKKDKS
jgi:hypothetical protein